MNTKSWLVVFGLKTMPVTKWAPNQGGRPLGFPNLITPGTVSPGLVVTFREGANLAPTRLSDIN